MDDRAAFLSKVFGALIARFRSNASGQIAIIFALASTAIVVGTGAGIDLSRAYLARQKISVTATLTCQYSSRPSVIDLANTTSGNSNGLSTYVSTVNTFAANTLTGQKLSVGSNTATGASGGTLFTAGAPTGTGAAATAPTNPTVDISLNVPTYFLKLANVTQIPVHAHVVCPTALNTTQGSDTPGSSSGNGNGNLVTEGFEVPSCTSYCTILPNGTMGTQSQPTNTFPPTAAYTGDHGSQFYIMGYCLEVDAAGAIFASDPQGTHAAELDCDNGSHSAGNSSISTRIYMPVGNYELRWDYGSRVFYPNYYPAYICGSTASDLSWANDTTTIGGSGSGSALRTNQINVYLDVSVNGAPPPLHTTLDGTQQLAGSNLIDMCVYAPPFVERSVKIVVTTPAYYWLSFAADGANDSYGGTIDNIRMCIEQCAGSPLDNFPSVWLPANNGGNNKVLFEDSFESPTYTRDAGNYFAQAGNLYNSLGSTSTSLCNSAVSSPPGWVCQSAYGWATAPYNEVVMWTQGAGSNLGSQYISLQGSNKSTNSGDPIDRSISKPFLLDPGYYDVSYNYTSLMDFSYSFIYGISCYYTSTSGYSYNNAPGSQYNSTVFGVKYGHVFDSPSILSGQYISTNVVQAFMSNGQMVSTPNFNSTLGTATSYANPDGTTTSSPKTPIDNGSNFTNYNASAPNPVIDGCGYSGGYAWTLRSTNIKITKPGIYWLTFSALGDPLTSTGGGPGIDDVKLTALGSLYMSNPPTSALTTVPVPSPQPDTIYNNSSAFNGFYIIADPKTPPAADQ